MSTDGWCSGPDLGLRRQQGVRDAMVDAGFLFLAKQHRTTPAGAGKPASPDYLAGYDSYSLFDRIGDLVKIGPTLTNVNDFRAVFIP